MLRTVAFLACLVSAARADTDGGASTNNKGFGKPTVLAVDLPPLPPLPTRGCVEVFSLGNCHTRWVGQYHEQAATLNGKPMWLAAVGGSVRVAD